MITSLINQVENLQRWMIHRACLATNGSLQNADSIVFRNCDLYPTYSNLGIAKKTMNKRFQYFRQQQKVVVVYI